MNENIHIVITLAIFSAYLVHVVQ